MRFRRPSGVTLCALADVLGLPRRTVQWRATEGHIRTRLVVGTGAERPYRYVDTRELRRLLVDAGLELVSLEPLEVRRVPP